jgi:hypothetical protein
MSQNLPRSLDQLPPRHRAEALRQLSTSGSAGKLAPATALQAADCKQPRAQSDAGVAPPARRIRQSTKPRSNKLEAEFGMILRARYPESPLWEQAITFRLANGVRYSPDWVRYSGVDMCCYEVKGRHIWDDSICKLKMAASVYPQIAWFLCDKPDGHWRECRVLP